MITDLWLKQLQPWLDKIWEDAGIWRVIVLLFILLGIIVFKYRKKLCNVLNGSDIKEHDKKIFREISAQLPEEDMMGFLGGLDADHSMWADDRKKIGRFLIEIQREDNRYLTKDLRRQADELKKCLQSLLDFIAESFFVVDSVKSPRGFYYRMYPEMRKLRLEVDVKTQQKNYLAYSKQLYDAADGVRMAYVKYRRCAKDKLHI
ncbi:MAG: hypothetical protein AB1814_17245 [Thermodesulfobacteriota bacterium]